MFVTIVEGVVETAREGDLRLGWDEVVGGVLPDGFMRARARKSKPRMAGG